MMMKSEDKLQFLLVCEFMSKQFHRDIPPSCFHPDHPVEKCNSKDCPLSVVEL